METINKYEAVTDLMDFLKVLRPDDLNSVEEKKLNAMYEALHNVRRASPVISLEVINDFINEIRDIKDLERYSSTVVGKVKYKDTIYFVLFEYVNLGANYGISGFTACDKMASANAQSSFLGCANKEIAEHFSKYFGALITEAKFGDLKDFSVISYNEIKKQ